MITTMHMHRSKHMATVRVLVLPLLLLLPALLPAQKLKERMADRYAEVFDYPKMALIYEDIIGSGKGDEVDLRNLAVAYRNMGMPLKAESTFEKLVASGKATPEDIYGYAEQLRANGRYPEALAQYKAYSDLRPEDTRVKGYLDNPGIFDRIMRDSTRQSIRKLPINSTEADLAPSVMEELLIFSSARGEGVGGGRRYEWDDQPFLNMYTALLKGETAEEALVLRNNLNSRYHDGTATYDSVANRIYFTRNNVFYGTVKKAKNGNLNLGIYFCDVVTGEFGQPEWGSLIPYDHNDPEYNYGHPCISPDGRKLFFASDRPGGLGGTDIWYSDNQGNKWGAPINMGPRVNTPGNEMFPYLHRDSTLYFASNGHPGLGGTDLFYSRLSTAGPGVAFNLGYPMNTRHNDHGLIFINDTVGFFASDRPGGDGSDDIYGCTVPPPMIFLAGIVIDKETRQPIEGAAIVMKDDKGEFIKRY